MRKKKGVSQVPTEVCDKRVERSKHAVLTAAYELLTQAGFSGVTVDAVSERSGVAKTTIYRHWPSRSALLMDACSKLGTKPEIPDTGSLKGDLMEIGTYIATQLRTASWPAALPSIIDAAERDPELAELHSSMHRARMGGLRTVIERGQARGELSSRRNVAEMIASIMGPLFYRRWFSREPLNDHFVKYIVETAVGDPGDD
jgi:AcrR family transcriptional regulator